MANSFNISTGLNVGPANFDAPTGDITTSGNIVAGNFIGTNAPSSLVAATNPLWNNVSLLLHANGPNLSTDIIDSTGKNTITVGGASLGWTSFISTVQSKFGGASITFDGRDDYLIIPASNNFSFGAGDFTVEAWLYLSSYPTGGEWRTIYSQWTAGDGQRQTGEWTLKMNSSGAIYALVATSSSNYVTLGLGNGPLSLNAWTHVAISRNGNSFGIFVNGVRVSYQSVNLEQVGLSTKSLLIGRQEYMSQWYLWHGYMDEIRVTKGTGLYTSNFAVPTQPFPNG